MTQVCPKRKKCRRVPTGPVSLTDRFMSPSVSSKEPMVSRTPPSTASWFTAAVHHILWLHLLKGKEHRELARFSRVCPKRGIPRKGVCSGSNGSEEQWAGRFRFREASQECAGRPAASAEQRVTPPLTPPLTSLLTSSLTLLQLHQTCGISLVHSLPSKVASLVCYLYSQCVLSRHRPTVWSPSISKDLNSIKHTLLCSVSLFLTDYGFQLLLGIIVCP